MSCGCEDGRDAEGALMVRRYHAFPHATQSGRECDDAPDGRGGTDTPSDPLAWYATR